MTASPTEDRLGEGVLLRVAVRSDGMVDVSYRMGIDLRGVSRALRQVADDFDRLAQARSEEEGQ